MFILLLSIPSALSWYLLYITLRKSYKNESPEFANRLATLCHATIMATFGSSQCFINGWAFRNCEEPRTNSQLAILLLSLGYFIFDLIWCAYYQTESKLMIAHHVYSCFAMARILAKGTLTNQATCALGLMEITNPLLQLRWFIRTLGYKNTLFFTIVELSFVLIFISMRLVLGTFVTLEVLIGNQDFEFKLLAIVIYLVSWGFMINMYMYIRRKYSEPATEVEDETDRRNTISTFTM